MNINFNVVLLINKGILYLSNLIFKKPPFTVYIEHLLVIVTTATADCNVKI